MSRTLLFVGDDPEVLAHLAHFDAEIAHVPTIDDARNYVIENGLDENYLVAYSRDIALNYYGGDFAPTPLDYGDDIVLLTGGLPAAVWGSALALRCNHVLELPECRPTLETWLAHDSNHEADQQPIPEVAEA